ncbi:hypothetical protein FB451DRAFT_1419733 [Mycena latifolia]|nr:hypothetical protein FB451DRAFT_1419733 [Mycena latifolia]
MSILETRPFQLAPARRDVTLPKSVDPTVAEACRPGSRASSLQNCANRESCESLDTRAQSPACSPSCRTYTALNYGNVAVGPIACKQDETTRKRLQQIHAPYASDKLGVGRLGGACWLNAAVLDSDATTQLDGQCITVQTTPTAAIDAGGPTTAISVPAHQAHGPFGSDGRPPVFRMAINPKVALASVTESPPFLPILILLLWAAAALTVKIGSVTSMRRAAGNSSRPPFSNLPCAQIWIDFVLLCTSSGVIGTCRETQARTAAGGSSSAQHGSQNSRNIFLPASNPSADGNDAGSG